MERALELDAEFGAPYGILCYVYIRQNKLEKAIDAGVKAVQHNPDVPHAALLPRGGLLVCQSGNHLVLTERCGPVSDFDTDRTADECQRLNLGAIAMETSAYDRAEQLVAEVLELERSKRGISRLPFGEIILAGVAMRRLDWAKALEWHERGLQNLAQIDRIYRETAIALNAR